MYIAYMCRITLVILKCPVPDYGLCLHSPYQSSLPITVQEIRDRLGKIRDQVARMYTVVNSRF